MMQSTHLYPDPSDLCPSFYLGEFDLDDMDQEPSFALGEAMLSVQRPSRPIAICPHAYAQAMRPSQDNSSYMFGLVTKQVPSPMPDDLVLNLWATELA